MRIVLPSLGRDVAYRFWRLLSNLSSPARAGDLASLSGHGNLPQVRASSTLPSGAAFVPFRARHSCEVEAAHLQPPPMDEQMKFAHRKLFSRREGDVCSGCSIEPSAGSKSGWQLRSRSSSRSRNCQPAPSSAQVKSLVGVKGRRDRADTCKASESSE
jgi:hypothetical protein